MLRAERRSHRYRCPVRVYIPAPLAMLARLVADEQMHALSGTAFAVTPTLRESYAEGDEDELSEVALREAALASLRLLAAEGDAGGQERSDLGDGAGGQERSDVGGGAGRAAAAARGAGRRGRGGQGTARSRRRGGAIGRADRHRRRHRRLRGQRHG